MTIEVDRKQQEAWREAAGPRPAIPRTVWALGFVSMFMEISSEMIHALLPLFLAGTLGASVAMMGMIEEEYRLPLCAMSDTLKQKLRASLADLGLVAS